MAVTIPNHVLLVALDLKHRYGIAAMELALQRITAFLESGESDDAKEWVLVATVLSRALLRPEDLQHLDVVHPPAKTQPTPE